MTTAPDLSPDPAETAPRRYTVVVGMSRRSGSPAALRWAAAEARQHDGVVYAVRAWRPPRPPAALAGRPPVVSVDAEEDFAAAEQSLKADVETATGSDAGIECRVVHGGRRTVLLDASTRADLLVLELPSGANPRSSPTLVHRLIHSAGCPVVVIPPTVPV
jgi:hypothetical protein